MLGAACTRLLLYNMDTCVSSAALLDHFLSLTVVPQQESNTQHRFRVKLLLLMCERSCSMPRDADFMRVFTVGLNARDEIPLRLNLYYTNEFLIIQAFVSRGADM